MVEEIKAWLKAYGRTREWLGGQLDCHKRTIDNWLSAGQPIPAAKLTLIARLIEDDQAAEAQRKQQLSPVNQVFSLEVDLPRFRRYSAAALAKSETLENWAIHALDEAAENVSITTGLYSRAIAARESAQSSRLNEETQPKAPESNQ